MSDYARMSFPAIEELPIEVYMLLLRDATIERLERTDEGRQYLADCWRLEQTEPDRRKLREKFGRKEDRNG